MCWKPKVRQLKGVSTDVHVIAKCQNLHNIEVLEEATVEVAKEKLSQAKTQQNELKTPKGMEKIVFN